MADPLEAWERTVMLLLDNDNWHCPFCDGATTECAYAEADAIVYGAPRAGCGA